jgi:hypothetical protein
MPGGLSSIKFDTFNASVSTLGSFSDNLFKSKNPEKIIQEIFEKYSGDSGFLTFIDFKHFLSSQNWIFLKIKESFRVDDWKNDGIMKLKTAKVLQPLTAPRKIQSSAKIFSHGKWISKHLVLKNSFLLVLNKKQTLEQVFFIEGCHFKAKDSSLFIIYSSQYDERIVFTFESDSECINFLNYLKEASPQKKFKHFYRIEEKIGYGKFSEVFLASEIENGHKWAVKIINKKMMNQAEREMIRKEVSILQNFSHPGIIKLKEVFDSHKTVKIVLEYVQGGDLLKKIKNEKADEGKIKETIQKILKVVQHFHYLGVIHRDVKPENILICEGNEDVKFIDFGLSTFTLPAENKNFKCGTLGYTAPEVFSGCYNKKVDLWSVGVITYAYLTGKLPFFSYSRDELVELTQNKELDFSDDIWNQYSHHALEFTKALLTKDPSTRPDCEEALLHKWFFERLD